MDNKRSLTKIFTSEMIAVIYFKIIWKDNVGEMRQDWSWVDGCWYIGLIYTILYVCVRNSP